MLKSCAVGLEILQIDAIRIRRRYERTAANARSRAPQHVISLTEYTILDISLAAIAPDGTRVEVAMTLRDA